ncbi:MAG: hypothetical protein ACRDYF_11375 [Acidimicrobiia bacterium]
MTDELVPDAWAVLSTDEAGAATTMHTTGLEPGSAYTLWWVIFNHPERCLTGHAGLRCGPPDLFNPEVDASMLFAAGAVVGEPGEATFESYRAQGDTSGAVVLPVMKNPAPGLTAPRTAEIHLVVRNHGPARPGYVEEQTTTMNGGCDVGQPNFPCRDEQYAAFVQS